MRTKYLFVGVYQKEAEALPSFFTKVILSTDSFLADLDGLCDMDAELDKVDYIILGSTAIDLKEMYNAQI